MFSIENFKKEYATDISEIMIAGRRFQFHVPGTIDRFIDSEDPLNQFPLWAKIWEASIVLAETLARQSPDPEKRYLEIGAGIGMVSIVADSFGHRMTMTEFDSHAIAFAKANAVLNQGSGIRIHRLDWHQPDLDQKYDFIVAAEIIYKNKDITPLKKLFQKYLKPDGEIILAGEMRNTNMEFFKQMDPVFDIRIEKKILRSQDMEIRIVVPRMRFK